jgi:hypothetical protein
MAHGSRSSSARHEAGFLDKGTIMKRLNPLLALILGLILFGCSAAATARQVETPPHNEWGVLETGAINGPGSTAVTATFSTPFEDVPVCTDAHRPNTVGSIQKTGGAAATLSVVLMNVTVEDVTFFVHNPNQFADSTIIHWHCIGQ